MPEKNKWTQINWEQYNQNASHFGVHYSWKCTYAYPIITLGASCFSAGTIDITITNLYVHFNSATVKWIYKNSAEEELDAYKNSRDGENHCEATDAISNANYILYEYKYIFWMSDICCANASAVFYKWFIVMGNNEMCFIWFNNVYIERETWCA